MLNRQNSELDRSAFSVVDLGQANGDREYWHRQSPEARIEHTFGEYLRSLLREVLLHLTLDLARWTIHSQDCLVYWERGAWDWSVAGRPRPIPGPTASITHLPPIENPPNSPRAGNRRDSWDSRWDSETRRSSKMVYLLCQKALFRGQTGPLWPNMPCSTPVGCRSDILPVLLGKLLRHK